MKRLDVIPKPNKVEFLGGEVDPSELEITYIEDKSLADEAASSRATARRAANSTASRP